MRQQITNDLMRVIQSKAALDWNVRNGNNDSLLAAEDEYDKTCTWFIEKYVGMLDALNDV